MSYSECQTGPTVSYWLPCHAATSFHRLCIQRLVLLPQVPRLQQPQGVTPDDAPCVEAGGVADAAAAAVVVEQRAAAAQGAAVGARRRSQRRRGALALARPEQRREPALRLSRQVALCMLCVAAKQGPNVLF
jgi:hypothetical protein